MAMKKLFFVTLIVATCMSIVTAAPSVDPKAAAAADPFFDPDVAGMDGLKKHGAAAAAAATAAGGPAAAPGGAAGPDAASGEGEAAATTGGGSSTPAAPSSASLATFPAMGTLVGASLLTFIAYYLH